MEYTLLHKNIPVLKFIVKDDFHFFNIVEYNACRKPHNKRRGIKV